MNIQRDDGSGQKARLFFALWPAPALQDKLHAEAQLCSRRQGGRAMRRETLHMTLLFLGDVMRDRIPELCRQVDRIACEPFAFHLRSLKCWRHNHIAYAALEDEAPKLHRLAMRLQEAAEAADVTFDRRTFTPHVTLVRKLERSFDAAPIELPEWGVTGFSLVESLLQAEGPRYRNLHAWSCR